MKAFSAAVCSWSHLLKNLPIALSPIPILWLPQSFPWPQSERHRCRIWNLLSWTDLNMQILLTPSSHRHWTLHCAETTVWTSKLVSVLAWVAGGWPVPKVRHMGGFLRRPVLFSSLFRGRRWDGGIPIPLKCQLQFTSLWEFPPSHASTYSISKNINACNRGWILRLLSTSEMSVTFLDVFVWKARGQCLSVDNVKMCQYLTETKTNTYMSRNFSTDVFCRIVGVFFSCLKWRCWDTAQLVESSPSFHEELASISSTI